MTIGYQRGKQKQAAGAAVEELFDISTAHYEANDLAKCQVNYPKTITKFDGKTSGGRSKFKTIIVGRAASDRTFTLAGGMACHIEIKSWQARDIHKISFTGKEGASQRAQYSWLKDMLRFTPLAFYVVCWKFNGDYDWRLHLLENIEYLGNGIRFYKDDGLNIDDGRGWPDWIGLAEAIKEKTNEC